VNGSNGVDRADIYLGFILDGYKKYENINDAFPDTRITFYSAPEINSSDELIQFDPSEDELIYVKVAWNSWLTILEYKSHTFMLAMHKICKLVFTEVSAREVVKTYVRYW